jgi:hypothetical protein
MVPINTMPVAVSVFNKSQRTVLRKRPPRKEPLLLGRARIQMRYSHVVTTGTNMPHSTTVRTTRRT